MSIKQTILISLAGGAMCAVGVVGFAVGQHNSATPTVAIETVAQPEGAQPTEEMMKQMMAEQAKLAPEHKHLLPMVGTWDAELSFLMEPGGEPEVSQGTCVNTMILGGRYMKSEFKAELNMFGDKMAFSGFGLMGFGKEKGEFVSTWCDTMSTSLLVSTGKPGEDAKVMTLTGMSSSPMGEVPMKNVYIIESDKAHTMEFWQGMPGSDEMMKIGWIKYTKKG
jgi:hypothetical protein